MRKLALVVAVTAACSGTDRRTDSGPLVASGSAARAVGSAAAAPAPGVLLGLVPTTSSYRVIACARGAHQRRACEAVLEGRVGTAVRGPMPDLTASIARTRVLATNDGEDSVAVELDRAAGPVVTSGATLRRDAATLTDAETKALRARSRAISPRAGWATGDRFEVTALEADVDGDRQPDRIAVGTIVDFEQSAERVVVVVAVGLAGRAFELVDFSADRLALLGTVDLDGDGRHEVLVDRTPHGDATSYRYELMHVAPRDPLALGDGQPGPLSAAWQPYDVLEERERDAS